jgi:hypothetical protein
MKDNNMNEKKAESLIINSIGQRPMKQKPQDNPKSQRGEIN